MKILCSIKERACDRFPALSHRNFRYFLAGQCVSLMGTWMQRTAQQWVVYQMTKSPLILGLIGVFQFTPALLFSLFAGVLVDRFPKKKFLMVTQTIQMLQAFVLAALLWSGHAQYWHLLIMAGVLGLVNTFDMPTRQSFFIELVGKKDLVSAIGLNSTIVNVAKITGPAFAGLILTYFGATFCFFANGLSFIGVLLGLVKIESYAINIRETKNNMLGDIKDGLQYVFANKNIAQAVILMLVVGTIAMNSDVIIPVFAREVLHQEARGYGFLMSAVGIGSLIGALRFATRKKEGFDSSFLFKNGLGLCAFLILAGFMHNYYLSLISVWAIGIFQMTFLATVNSTIQLNSSDEYRGRAMGIYTLVFTGTTPMGNFFTGWVTERYGPNISFLICGGLTAVLILGLIVWLKPNLRLKRSTP